MRGQSPEETAMDLVIEDGSRVGTVYFLMSEENVASKSLALGELLLGCGVLGRPRACFSRRAPTRGPTATSPSCWAVTSAMRKLIPLEEAIRKLTSLPAENLRINQRGALKTGVLCRRRRLRSGQDSRPCHI